MKDQVCQFDMLSCFLLKLVLLWSEPEKYSIPCVMMDRDEEVDFAGILGDLSLESEAEPAPSESASSIDAEARRRMDFRNPIHVWIEVNYDDLGLGGQLESMVELCELFSEFGQITVDDVKKSLVSHLWYAENNFRLLRRHFQLSIYVPHTQEWQRVSFDSTLLECVSMHQISRQARYRFKLNLNLGIRPENCGRP